MSYTQHKSETIKTESQETETDIAQPTYEYAKEIISKQIECLKDEMNRTEIEWLNLCNLAQQAKGKTTPEAKPSEPLFKDAAELNAVPLPVKLEDVDVLNFSFDEEDLESSDGE